MPIQYLQRLASDPPSFPFDLVWSRKVPVFSRPSIFQYWPRVGCTSSSVTINILSALLSSVAYLLSSYQASYRNTTVFVPGSRYNPAQDSRWRLSHPSLPSHSMRGIRRPLIDIIIVDSYDPTISPSSRFVRSFHLFLPIYYRPKGSCAYCPSTFRV